MITVCDTQYDVIKIVTGMWDLDYKKKRKKFKQKLLSSKLYSGKKKDVEYLIRKQDMELLYKILTETECKNGISVGYLVNKCGLSYVTM